MSDSRPNRPQHRTRLVLLAVTVLAVIALPTPAATAQPTAQPTAPKHVARAALVGADADPNDESTKMPRTMRDDLTGDFLGLGYDQRMRAEDSSLNIYDNESRGGGLLQSTAMDLSVPPAGGALFNDGIEAGRINLFSAWTSLRNRSGAGIPAQRRDDYHLNTILLATVNGSIFISGTKGSTIYANGTGSDAYRVLVYKVPFNGSCASEACALKVASLPTDIEVSDPTTLWYEHRSIGVTALAAGWNGSLAEVVVGLSDYGVYTFHDDLTAIPFGTWGGMNIPTDPGTQTVVTAISFLPNDGQQRLIICVMGISTQVYVVSLLSSGQPNVSHAIATLTGDTNFSSIPLSAAGGYRPNSDGARVATVGMSNGTMPLIQTDNLSPSVINTTTLAAPAVAINPVPRLDTTGGTDWAVATQTGADIGNGVGQMFRDNGTTLIAQKLSIDDNGTTQNYAPDRTSFRSWFPGYRQGRFRLVSGTDGPTVIKLWSDFRSGAGCWLAYDSDGNAFPEDGITLLPTQEQSAYFTLGAYTAGVGEAGCSQDPSVDGAGSWRGYLSFTPLERPGDTRIVGLNLNKAGADPWTVDTSDQAGGSTGLIVIPEHDPSLPVMPYGYHTFYFPGPVGPIPGPAPALTAYRLSGPVRNVTNGVYRIDVGKLSWTVSEGDDAGTTQIQTVTSPLRVQGLSGTTWTDLGGFMPLVKPASSTSNGVTTITMGTNTTPAGTFYWENPLNGPAYTQLRVQNANDDGTSTSTPVVLANTAPYGPAESLSQITLTPPNNGNATPVPNGVDAAPVQVAISAANAQPGAPVLDASDLAYKSVYYRDPQGHLVTNLYPVDPTPASGCSTPCYSYDSFIGVQPGVTAYPTVGVSKSGQSFDYVTTTLAAEDGTEQLTSYVGLAKTPLSSPGTVTVGGTTSTPNSSISGGDGRAGFSVEGCVEGTCRIPAITATQPALYQAGSQDAGPSIGFQQATQATTSLESLPLTWKGNYQPALATSPLSISSSYLIRLASPNNFPANTTSNPTVAQTVDITLVSHGQPLSLERIGVPAATTSAVKRRHR
ncbi:hypothetical protein [Microlunatus ginsengisoli]|uniref:Uncharacterized protein n=1 Tax=Microlunatus ginsengisoli TaxID=363863 RepID=A0ABP7A952_9ACTN